MSTAYSEGSQKIEKGQLEELPQVNQLYSFWTILVGDKVKFGYIFCNNDR